VQVWRHTPPVGRRVPLPGGTAYPEAHAPDLASDAPASSAADEPLSPPSHVTRHVSEWQRQQALYRGALQPGVVTSGDDAGADGIGRSLSSLQQVPIVPEQPEGERQFEFDAPAAPEALVFDRVTGASSRSESPVRSAGCGGANSPEQQQQQQHAQPAGVLAAQRTANTAARARARSDLFRRHAAAAHAPPLDTATPRPGSASPACSPAAAQRDTEQQVAQPQGGVAAALEDLLRESAGGSEAEAGASQLRRVAGGGRGLAGASANGSVSAASHSGAAPAMADVTNVGERDAGTTANAAGVPVVQASRCVLCRCTRCSIQGISLRYSCCQVEWMFFAASTDSAWCTALI
jgi:hypothetical protein